MISCLLIKIGFFKLFYFLLKIEEIILYIIYFVCENKEKSVFIINYDRVLFDMNVIIYSFNIMYEYLLVCEYVYFWSLFLVWLISVLFRIF